MLHDFQDGGVAMYPVLALVVLGWVSGLVGSVFVFVFRRRRAMRIFWALTALVVVTLAVGGAGSWFGHASIEEAVRSDRMEATPATTDYAERIAWRPFRFAAYGSLLPGAAALLALVGAYTGRGEPRVRIRPETIERRR